MSTATVWSRTPPQTHTYHPPLSTSQPLNLDFCLFRQCFYWLSFFNEKLVPLYAFYGLQNAAYNNVFNINVQDFCGSMTVCFVFFCTANVDKRGVETKGRQKLLYCCRHAIVILYHPPSGQCSGNEVQRVSQVILHSGGVYVCVYMCIYPYASPLDYAIPFSLTKISLSCPILSSPLFFSAVDFDSEYNVLVHPP